MKNKKCNSKKCLLSKSNVIKCDCKSSIDHISRIEGQLRKLKEYVEEENRCADVAKLSTSIAKSFDSLRVKTLKNFVMNEILRNCHISDKKIEEFDEILKLYKK